MTVDDLKRKDPFYAARERYVQEKVEDPTYTPDLKTIAFELDLEYEALRQRFVSENWSALRLSFFREYQKTRLATIEAELQNMASSPDSISKMVASLYQGSLEIGVKAYHRLLKLLDDEDSKISPHALMTMMKEASVIGKTIMEDYQKMQDELRKELEGTVTKVGEEKSVESIDDVMAKLKQISEGSPEDRMKIVDVITRNAVLDEAVLPEGEEDFNY